MKGFFKQRKGFSLVELLIALLIMAIIAGTAITLFGGVLETSRGGADRETADAIKRAILTYVNAANDPDLSTLGVTDGASSQNLVDELAKTIRISGAGTTGATVTSQSSSAAAPSPIAGATAADKEIDGTYGPFLEKEDIKPEQNGMVGWAININTLTQVITVTSTDEAADAVITITP